MSFDASLLVMMGIFWITYLILRTFFFKPMLDLLEKRESTITTAQTTYDAAVSSASERIDQEKARLTAGRQEAMAAREEERREAQDRRLELLGTVKAQVQRDLNQASQELESQVEGERSVLAQRARDIADRMAERLLGRSA